MTENEFKSIIEVVAKKHPKVKSSKANLNNLALDVLAHVLAATKPVGWLSDDGLHFLTEEYREQVGALPTNDHFHSLYKKFEFEPEKNMMSALLDGMTERLVYSKMSN